MGVGVKSGVGEVVADMIPMLPHVPGNVQEFLDDGGGPAKAIATAFVPLVVVVLGFSDLGADAAHHEVVPSYCWFLLNTYAISLRYL